MNPTPDTSELDKFMQEMGYVLADNIVGEFDHYIDYHDQSWIPVKTATKMFDLINQKLAEARIDIYKEVGQLFCGIPTKTLKRADLKEWLLYRIKQLNKEIE